jgi:hypothetical protein
VLRPTFKTLVQSLGRNVNMESIRNWGQKHSRQPREVPKYTKDWVLLQRLCESQTSRILGVILEPKELPKNAQTPSKDGWFLDHAVTRLVERLDNSHSSIRELQRQLQESHPQHLAELQKIIEDKQFNINRLMEEKDNLEYRLKHKEEHIDMLKNDLKIVRSDQSKTASDRSAGMRSLSENHERIRKGLEDQLDDSRKHHVKRESALSKTIADLNEELRKLQNQPTKGVSEDVMKESLRAAEDRHRMEMNTLRGVYSGYIPPEQHEDIKTQLQLETEQHAKTKAEYKDSVPAANLATARRELQQAVNKHEVQCGEHEDEVRRLNEKYDLKVSSFEGERKAALEDLEREHGRQINKLRNSHREELKKARDKFEAEKADAQETAEVRERALRDQLQAAATKLREFKDYTVTMQKNHDGALEEIRRAHAVEDRNLREGCQFQLGKLREDHEKESQSLATSHKKAIETLKRVHSQDTFKLRSQVDSLLKDHQTTLKMEQTKYLKKTEAVRIERDNLQKLLLQQERFSGLTDSEMERKFKELVTAVTDVSMSTWTGEHPIWKRTLLKKLSDNQGEIKQYILQDALWRFLHERIYCSPFRIFGQLGTTCEKEWSQGFGQSEYLGCKESHADVSGDAYQNGSFTWPNPTAESERFRFTTMEAAIAAMRFPTTEVDPRAKYKTAFVANREKFARELAALVSEYTEEDSIQPQLKKVISKAYNLWLEFCVQRCRIMVVLPSNTVSDIEERVELAKAHSLELTLKPILQRHGNGLGNDLDEMTIVAGCSGESATIGGET